MQGFEGCMRLQGKWKKIGGGWVDVTIFGFSVAQQGNSDLRPVAIVQERSGDSLRFVDLTFVRVEETE